MPPEPVITFVGITRADDTIVSAAGTTPQGYPIYERSFGSGFSLVVEARRGGTNVDIETQTYKPNPVSPTDFPGVIVFFSNALGDGSLEVCDDTFPTLGGIPAVDPPETSNDPMVIDAINDIGCRFKDGTGQRLGRKAEDACTLGTDGNFGMVDRRSVLQFCGLITEPLEFPQGDTLVTFQVSDVDGDLSAPKKMVIRVK